MTTAFRSAGRTDIGKLRRRNEDAILVREQVGLWAVADGVGGHAAGDVASSLIVERLANIPRAGDLFDFIDAIDDALIAVNQTLRDTARAQGTDIVASTVVVLVHDAHCMLCGWVGDSRAYCRVDGTLAQLTRDHLFGHEHDATDWRGGPDMPQPGHGVLSRAIGAEASVFVDWVATPSTAGAQFVLCSDGLNKEMSDTEINAACTRDASPSAVLDELFRITLARGARDNVSAIVVQLLAAGDPLPGIDAINRALKALDDTHRAGSIDREHYRAQRRTLFATGTDGSAIATGAQKRSPGRGWLARMLARLRRR